MSKRIMLALVSAIAAALLLASPALGAFGLKDLSVSFRAANGTPITQAGSHPFSMQTTVGVNTTLDEEGQEVPEGEVRNLQVDLPPGFAGSPNAVPFCPAVDFVEIDINLGRPTCPDSTVLGVAAVKLEFHTLPPGEEAAFFHTPVYNLKPAPGEALKLGFAVKSIPVTISNGVREEAPNRVFASLVNIPQAALFYSSKVTLWGNPADADHDSERGSCVETNLPSEVDDVLPLEPGKKCHVEIPETPFITLPRSCSGPLVTDFKADSWQKSGNFVSGKAITAPGMTGCSGLGFSPQLDVQPTTTRAESPSGMDFDLTIDDVGLTSVDGVAQSDIKKAVVILPQGVTANPSAAEGLGVCTKANFEAEKLASTPGQGCPEASKIGSAEVETPLLEGEVFRGSLYIAQQDDPATAQPGTENPFDTLLALYMVIRSRERGVMVKLPVKVEPDQITGQLISTLDNIPQFPVSRFHLHFREGGRSPLVSPPTCGTYTTQTVFYPWARPSEANETTSSFTINQGVGGAPCPSGVPPFLPGFEAGSINNNAGSYSPFYLRLTRQDGEQNMTRFSAVLAKGVSGKLAGVPACPETAIAAAKAKTGREELASPSCPTGSRIGHILAGAGVGSELTYVPGQIYMGGPFAGNPLSVIVITPAVAGPFDAGTVVVRQALNLDPNTAEVRVDGAHSDPIPRILKGIPLKLRDLRVYVDRPQFAHNPTSCDPTQTTATLFGDFLDVFSSADDAPVSLASRYQAAGCASLAFKPRLSLKLTGGTKRAGHPALRVVFQPRPEDANTRKLRLTLPHSAFLDQAHIRTVCTRVQFAVRQCPAGSIYGHARALSPLLDEPLEGPIYLRSSSNPLPDLVLALRGIVDFNGIARIDAVNGQLRSTVDFVPDVPITKVIVEMQGGNRGLIVNSRNLCSAPGHAKANFVGHNGKRHQSTPVVRNSCGKKNRRSAP
ncbi:MAG TPA: hypothetical protein VFI03_01045 [Solirubrobacterales bacterium]|nr:hypothetical protein [Solirubrobacterales bacterium]